MLQLETDRLLLRAPVAEDAQALAPMYADPEVMRYFPSTHTREQSEALANHLRSRIEERGWGLRDDSFTVFDRLTKLGAPSWFGLSDRDLAACL